MIDEEGTLGAGRGPGSWPEQEEKGAVRERATGRSSATAVFRTAADQWRNDRAEGGEERFAPGVPVGIPVTIPAMRPPAFRRSARNRSCGLGAPPREVTEGLPR